MRHIISCRKRRRENSHARTSRRSSASRVCPPCRPSSVSMAPVRSDPIRLRIVDADAETRALIASLLTSHTGRTYIVEPIEAGEGFAGMPATASEAERRASEALRESEAQLAAVLADRERLERQFYQAQKMETVGQLAGGIAHDFNNILTAIVGFGTLVAEQVSENESAARNTSEILAAANRASALTRQLLAFGRRQVLHPRRLNLNDTVQALIGMLRQLIGENIDLRIVCASQLPPIRADLSQLESALANLVINARDAMPRGGRLTIETADVTLDDDYAATHVGVRPGRYARMSVSDTGIGMSQELQTRIFEPFFTTKEPGKGSGDRKSTRLNSSHRCISYAVFCLKKKKNIHQVLALGSNICSSGFDVDGTDLTSLGQFSDRVQQSYNDSVPRVFVPCHGTITTHAL